MNEKKSKQNESSESDKQFLDRSGATSQIRDALAKIIENRPTDPISFLVNYFQSFDGGADLVTKTCQQLTLTHYTAAAFEINVKIAFDIYSSNKVVGKNIRGVTGSSFMDLLKLLTRGFPVPISEELLLKLYCQSDEAISFALFKYGIFVCLVMQDYLKQAGQLYMCLDVSQSDQVDSTLCEAVLQYLQTVISVTSDAPQSILSAGYMLQSDMIASHISKTISAKPKYQPSTLMSKEEFLLQAADSFLSVVSIS